jgi:tRNA (adenine37-N6)-methyltransferase
MSDMETTWSSKGQEDAGDHLQADRDRPIPPQGSGECADPAGFAKGIEGQIELDPSLAPGLKDLEGFSHLILLYHFHRTEGYDLLARPFLDSDLHGVFAIRTPRRPNPIGLSVVRLLGIEGNVLRISDVDILDGTPILDIKPYVPEFDHREGARIGWLEGRVQKQLK